MPNSYHVVDEYCLVYISGLSEFLFYIIIFIFSKLLLNHLNIIIITRQEFY